MLKTAVDRFKINIYILGFILIFLLGIFLRSFQLGNDSFWVDEAGQFIVANKDTMDEFFIGLKRHVMAMPLDYLITRFVSQFSYQESILRIPSLIWGSLSILSLFLLVKRISNQQIALFSALFLSLSSIHIRYAQEMRFYSALLFFYLFTSYLGVRAIQSNKIKFWVLYFIFTLIGAYFHPFTLLSIVSGWLLIFFESAKERWSIKRYFPISIVTIGLILAFLPAYLEFGSKDFFSHELFKFGDSPIDLILTGLGWTSVKYKPSTPIISAWTYILVLSFLTGLISIFRNLLKFRAIGVFLLSAVLQIIVIILANYYQSYYFVSRQIIHIAPIFFIGSAVGIVTLLDYIKKQNIRDFAAICLALVICLTSIPNLENYYQYEKSNGREVSSNLLISANSASDWIFIIPNYDNQVLVYYLNYALGNHLEISERLVPTTWQNLEKSITEHPGNIYLVATSNPLKNEQQILNNLGFSAHFRPAVPWVGTRSIYLLEP